MAERKEKSQMVGDGLREVSVLLVVFYTLDTTIKGDFDWINFGIVALAAAAIFYLGMILEGRDEL